MNNQLQNETDTWQEMETIHIDFEEIDMNIEIKDSFFYESISKDAEVIE